MAARVGTREEWLAARVEQEYEFDTNEGRKTLRELFHGRSQLVVYHFMHGPNTPDGCLGCTFAADGFEGAATHLANHDVTFLCASRSPLETLDAYKERMGWSFPWVSSGGSDFSAFNEEDRENGTGFNFGSPGGAGIDVVHDAELMALSAFVLEDGVVYHTYSAYDRGTDVLDPTWQLLDRSPRGRDDGVERDWPRRHDEYESAARDT